MWIRKSVLSCGSAIQIRLLFFLTFVARETSGFRYESRYIKNYSTNKVFIFCLSVWPSAHLFIYVFGLEEFLGGLWGRLERSWAVQKACGGRPESSWTVFRASRVNYLSGGSVWEASWGESRRSLGSSWEPSWFQVGSQEEGFWEPRNGTKMDVLLEASWGRYFHEFWWILGRQNEAMLTSNWSSTKRGHGKRYF